MSVLHHRFRKTRLPFETLETRNLLAADLSVTVSPFEMETAGQQVTRTVRVANNGDEDAVDAVVRSLLSDQLEDATWTRTGGHANFIHREAPTATPLQTIRGVPGVRRIRLPELIGDVNDDGLSDYWLQDQEHHYIVFGQQGETLLADIPREAGSYDSPIGVIIEHSENSLQVIQTGDFNGDSILDLVLNDYVSNFVLFGASTLGAIGPIDLDELSGAGFRVDSQASLAVDAVFGDVNGDGFQDLFAENTVVFGSADIGASGVVSLMPDENPDSVYRLPFKSTQFRNAGDLNHDGFDDFGFHGVTESGEGELIRIVLGGPEYFQVGKPLTYAGFQPTLRDGWGWTGQQSYAVNAGDLNGDGIDDLMYRMSGPDSQGTTFSAGKEAAFVRNGVNIVFGRPSIVDAGTIDVLSEGITIQLVTNYGGTTPRVEDINDDGIQDIVLFAGGRELVIFGGPDLGNLDLGVQSRFQQDSLDDVLDGRNGFVTSRVETSIYPDFIQSFDGAAYLFRIVQRDALDVLEVSTLDVPDVWWTPTIRNLNGNGDILEQATIPAGESLVYSITGILKEDAEAGIHRSAVLPTRSAAHEPAFAADSLAGRFNVDIDVRLSHTPLEVGKPATFEIMLENSGQSKANNLSLVESVTNSLDDASWTLTTERQFPDVPDDGWTSQLGPTLNGFSVNMSEDRHLTYATYANLGSSMGVGDENGDGYVDFYVGTSRYFGGERFGATGFEDVLPAQIIRSGAENAEAFKPSTVGYISLSDESRVLLQQEESHVFSVGDMNADGHDDFAVSGDEDSPIYLVLGRDNYGTGMFDVKTGIAFEFDEELSMYFILQPGHDLDGDGHTDLIFSAENRSDYSKSGFGLVQGGPHLDSISSVTPKLLPSPLYNIDYAPSPDSVSIGDFNGDGLDDLAMSRFGTTIYLAGEEVFERAPLAFPGGNLHAYFGASRPFSRLLDLDINGDGVDDLLIAELTQPPNSPYYSDNSGQVSLLLGRSKTDLAGDGEFDQPFSIAPGEQLLFRITGTVTEDTLSRSSEVTVVVGGDQYEMNPFNNSSRLNPTSSLFADVDGNGLLEFADFAVLSENFGRNDVRLFEGDLNGDGRVDFADFLLLSEQFKVKQ